MRSATKKKTSTKRSRSRKSSLTEVMRQHPMLIEWSEEDQLYLASFPTLAQSRTHGKTAAEAAQRGMELLETLLMYPEPAVAGRKRA